MAALQGSSRGNGATKIKGMVGTANEYISIFSADKVAAVLLWLSSAYMTSQFISQLRGNSNISITNPLDSTMVVLWGTNFVGAIVLQAILTIAERAVWKGKEVTLVSGTALAIDTFVNAASLWPFFKAFGLSNVWSFIREIVQYILPSWNVEYNLGVAGVLALIGGVALAYGPEKLWSR